MPLSLRKRLVLRLVVEALLLVTILIAVVWFLTWHTFQIRLCHGDGNAHHDRHWRQLFGYRRTFSTCRISDKETGQELSLATTVFYAQASKGLVFLCRTPKRFAKRALPYLKRGYDVIIYNARGEGDSCEAPNWSESSLMDEALQVFEQTRNALEQERHDGAYPRTYIVGYCHGSASAAYIAAHSTHVRLILVGAFPDMPSVVARYTGDWLLRVAPWIVPVRFDVKTYLKHTRASHIHIVHGEHDELMPVQFAYELAAIALSAKVCIHILPDRARHNNVPKTDAFKQVLEAVLD